MVSVQQGSMPSPCLRIVDTHSCQPVMTKKRDKILKKVGFSVDKLKILDKKGKNNTI